MTTIPTPLELAGALELELERHATATAELALRVADLEPPGPVFPTHPMVAPERLANITGHPALTRVMAQRADSSSGGQPWGSATYSPGTPGVAIDDSTTERERLKDDGCAAFVQALAWAGGRGEVHRDNVLRIADAYATVRSLTSDRAQSRKLRAAWAIPNMGMALSMVGEREHPLVAQLVPVWWPMFDHPGNANWHGSFTHAQAVVAVLTGDTELLARALNYLELRVAQAVYLRQLDGLTVRSLTSEALTLDHWHGQVGTSLRPSSARTVLVAELAEDLGHTMMGLGSFAEAALVLRTQGVPVPAHVLARLASGAELTAAVLLPVLKGGTIASPYVLGALDRLDGWLSLRQLLGPQLGPLAAEVCTTPAVLGRNGANGLPARVVLDS